MDSKLSKARKIGILWLFGIIIGGIIIIAIVDTWLYKTYGVDATMSRVMRDVGHSWPIMPFALGFIFGGLVIGLGIHFWWSMPAPLHQYDRDELGKIVNDAWIKWAIEQPNPKNSWLIPYEALSEPEKEADRQIGEAVINAVKEYKK